MKKGKSTNAASGGKRLYEMGSIDAVELIKSKTCSTSVLEGKLEKPRKSAGSVRIMKIT